MGKNSREDHFFEEIYSAYFRQLCYYAYSYVEDKNEAYEIVQNSFLKIWEQKETLQKIVSIKSYLYRTVHNACINYFESRKAQHNYLNDAAYQLKMIEMDDFEDAYANFERQQKLEQSIHELPTKNREVFNLRYVEQKSYRDIAFSLGISERTVEAHLRKSIEIIKKKVGMS
ncbi:MAG: RNA polymerase sigma-70 factor [Paludibacteraceae bacterium]|nr:RNA polymerase sigma-70 factor [Paludibacteraceae bacterium]